MKSNENSMDRGIRVVLGLVALAASYFGLGVLEGDLVGMVVATIGVILLLTGLVGFCPAYRLVGLSTCSKENCGDSCGCNNE
jgi:hypothetical protein